MKNKTLEPLRQLVVTPTKEKSNFPSVHRYVVQAWSNIDGWQGSKYGAALKGAAIMRAELLLNQDSCWMGQHRLVRVVPAISVKGLTK